MSNKIAPTQWLTDYVSHQDACDSRGDTCTPPTTPAPEPEGGPDWLTQNAVPFRSGAKWHWRLALLGWLAVATGFAQPMSNRVDQSDFMTMSLEELGSVKVPTVTGASKHDQKTTDAP